MGENLAFLEQRVVAQRRDIAATVEALKYRADFKHRVPEYVEQGLERALQRAKNETVAIAAASTRRSGRVIRSTGRRIVSSLLGASLTVMRALQFRVQPSE